MMMNIGHRHPVEIEAGDTIDFSSGIIANGFITGSGKVVYIEIPLGKGIDAAASVSATGKISFRGVKGYMPSGSQYNYVFPSGSGYSIATTIQNYALGIIRIVLSATTAMSNATNNTPVAAECYLTLTFS